MTTTTYDLNYDGDTTVVDGHTIRLRFEPDMDVSINDYDCYGRYDYGHRSPYSGNVEMPSDFDPDRTQLLTILNDVVWWEAPEDFVNLPAHEQDAFRWHVAQLVSFGFTVVVLERLEGKDYYGRPIVVAATALGGVDTTEQPYLNELIDDMISEVLTD
jgi:hypothetical protein